MQLFEIGDGLFADGIVFKIVPHSFIRVEFGRIRWQEEKTKTLFDFFALNKFLDALCFMHRMPINNQENHFFGTVKKTFDKFNKYRSANTASHCHKAKLSLGIDCRNHIHAETRPGCADDRRFAFDGPGCAGMMIRTDACFISKVYLCFQATGHAFDAGIFFGKPFLDFFRLLLVRPPHRLLRRKPHLIQKATDRRLAQLDPKSSINNFSNHFRRPQCKGKLQLQRIFHCDGLVNPLHGFSIKFRRAASSFSGIQRLPSASSIKCKPAIDRSSVDSHGFGDDFRALAILNACYSALSYLGKCLVIESSGIVCSHALSYITNYSICVHNFETVNMSHRPLR